MRYSHPTYWKNDFERDGLLYFAHRIEEMLFDYSSSLYRVPLLNTNGLIEEYCQVFNAVKTGVQREYQREIVFEEFLHSLKNDIVLKECWGIKNIEQICNNLGASSLENKYNIINYLLSVFNNKIYYDWCEKTVKKYIAKPKEKKNLESAIRCWLPELISYGYDVNYIYVTLRQFFFTKNVISESSVEDFFNIFDFKRHTYSVYFAASNTLLMFKDILMKRLNAKFEDDGMFVNFYKRKKDIVIYFQNIPARCPNLAAQIALSQLNLFLKFYKFVGNKKYVQVKNKAMVIEDKSKSIDFVDSQKSMFHIPDEINLKKIAMISEQLIFGLLENAENDYSIISRAIDLHNNALYTSDLESGYLNLWSSIEVMCGNTVPDSKIQSVMDIVIPILEKDYISDIVVNIMESLKDNIVKENLKEILGQIAENDCKKKIGFYLIFLPQYAELRKKLYIILKDFPVLRSRISQLSSLNKTKHLNEYVSKYKQRITWHLYRMYRVRNGIIHSGESPDYIKHLGEHLHSYSDAVLNEFVVKLSGDIPFSSTANIITDIKLLSENFRKVLLDDADITEEVIHTMIHPEIGNVMRCETHSQTVSE